jgi:Na+-translocating ferredoxin:NAD+ oxidoreductase RnfC subunit
MVKFIEIESSFCTSYKRGDRIKEGDFLGLTPDLNGPVFSPYSGKIKSMTVNTGKQVIRIEIETEEDKTG